MGLGSRIKSVRGQLSQGDFAATLGVSKSAIGGYERGIQTPGATVIMAICERFHVEPRWLLFGTGQFSRPSMPPKNFPQTTEEDIVRVPIVEARLQDGAFAAANGGENRFSFGRNFLEKLGEPSRMVLMRLTGNCMEPKLLDGDAVLIDQDQTTPLPGRLFAVSFESLVYIKTVDALPGRLILRSFNPACPAVELPADCESGENIRFLGKAVWACHNLN